MSRTRMHGHLGSPPGWRWGDLFPARGAGRCYRCHRPWWAVAQVTVWENETSGSFALCRGCWARSSTAQRLAAYLWLTDQQERAYREIADDRPELDLPDRRPRYGERRARLTQAIEADDPHLHRSGPAMPGGAS